MQKSRYKRNKMGCLPGDISKSLKIAMLEKEKFPIEVFPWHSISSEAAKVYRKDHQRKANRKCRHNAEKEIREQSTD